MKLTKILAFLAVFGLLGTANAAPNTAPFVLAQSKGVLLSGVALNAAAATRTITLSDLNQRWARVLFTVNFTYGAATTVTITPTCTDNSSLTKGSILSGSVASGTSTDTVYTRSFATGSASKNFQWNMGIAGQASCAFVFSGASAGANDLVTISATLVDR